jgi:AAA domain
MLLTPNPRGLQAATYDDDDVELIGAAEEHDDSPSFAVVSSFLDPSEIEPRPWVYGRHLLLGTVSATIGDGGIGKTTLLLTEAVAMATGRNLLGIEPRGRQKVFYWNGDEPIAELQRRVAAICQHFKLRQAELDGWLFVTTALDFPIIVGTAEAQGSTPRSPDEAGLAKLCEFVGEHEIDVVIIDPFVACHRVPENDNTLIDSVVKTWAKIAAARHVAIELVHHTRKPPFGGAAEVGVDDGRGASAFKDAVRSARALNRMTEAEGQRAGVDNHRSYFRADNGKANYVKPPDGAAWFKLISAALPNGDKFQPDDEVGVVVPWHYPAPFDGVTEAHMVKVRTMAAEGQYRSDTQSDDWIGRAVAEVLRLDVDDDKARIKAVLKVWIANGALKVVERRDGAQRKVRAFVVPGDWQQD